MCSLPISNPGTATSPQSQVILKQAISDDLAASVSLVLSMNSESSTKNWKSTFQAILSTSRLLCRTVLKMLSARAEFDSVSDESLRNPGSILF